MTGGKYRGLAVAVTLLSVTMAFVLPQQLYAEDVQGETAVLAVQFKGVDDPVRIQVSEKIVEETLSDLRLKEDVLFAERAATYKSVALPANDAYFSEQWYLWKIGVPEVWEKTIGDSKVIVAVLDTGIDIDHVDLRENIWVNTKESANGRDSDGNGYIDDIQGWNFIENNNNLSPAFNAYTENGINHGTLIAGEIGAKGGNGQGVAGVNWRVSMMPVRVLTSSGMGDVVNVVKGINYAIRNGAHVINLSFTGINNSAILTDAIRRAHDAGILVVAAAGNDDALNGGVNLTDRPAYPVCSDGPNGENWVVGVAATDEQDRKAPFSAYGDCIDVTAPGTRVFSTKLYEPTNPRFTQRYGGLFNGTSLASPLVAGSAALLKAYNPSLTMLQIRDILLQTADSIDAKNPNYHGKLGKGRINVLRAMYSAPTPNGDHTGVKPTNSVEQIRPEQASGSTTGIVTSAGTGLPPEVSVYLRDGSRRAQFLAYSEKFHGGVRTAVGDVDGDGNLEIVTAPGASGGPHVRVFNLGGRLESEFFAYEPTYTGGLSVAVGDTDGDGIEEIVVGPIGAHTPEVRVFDPSGNQKHAFNAYDPSFRGGIYVAMGDTNGNGLEEIVTAPASGGGPHIRAFNGSGMVQSQFFAYDTSVRSGYLLAVGDVNGDGRAEIGTLDVSRGRTIVFANRSGGLVGEVEIDGFGTGFTFTVGDMDRDFQHDLILGVQPNTSPLIRIYTITGKFISQITVGDALPTGPIWVSPIDWIPL